MAAQLENIEYEDTLAEDDLSVRILKRFAAERDAGYVAGKNDGYVAGKDDGYVDGKNDGYVDGKNDGYVDGKNDGYVDGKNDGYVDGKREGLLAVVRAAFGDLVAEELAEIRDVDALSDAVLRLLSAR